MDFLPPIVFPNKTYDSCDLYPLGFVVTKGFIGDWHDWLFSLLGSFPEGFIYSSYMYIVVLVPNYFILPLLLVTKRSTLLCPIT